MTTETLTLADFLLARITEDEAAAKMPSSTQVDWDFDDSAEPSVCAIGWVVAQEVQPREAGHHIARHDPARVLAECESKRRVVAEHPALDVGGEPGARSGCDRCSDFGGPYGFDDPDNWVDWPCPTLRALALPYAEHPEYRPEWAP